MEFWRKYSMTRKMKDSGIEWIGEIPEDWGVNKLKHICDFKNGLAHEKNVELKGTYTVVNSKFVSTEGKVRVYSNELIVPLHKNDVCIVMSDVPNGKAYAKCYIIEKGNAYTLNQRIGCFYNIKIDLKYFYYYLNRNQGLLIFDDGINQTNLRKPDLINLMFLIPPLVEQKQIANYLDTKCSKIDETIQKEKQVIEKLKQYKQSVITEAVTKGLDPDVKMKDSGVEWIGEIPEHWDIKCLKYLAASEKNSIVDGPFGSDMKNEEYVDEGVPIIQLNNIGEGVHKLNNLKYITEEKANGLKRHTIYPREIVIAKMMPAGRAAIVSSRFNKYIVSSDSIRLKLNSNSLNNFIVYCLNIYAKNEAEIQSTGTTRSRINLSIVKNLHLAVPCLTEQKQIADYLDKKCASIDKAILNKEKLIEKLTEYKKSLIYECVTGKREV